MTTRLYDTRVGNTFLKGNIIWTKAAGLRTRNTFKHNTETKTPFSVIMDSSWEQSLWFTSHKHRITLKSTNTNRANKMENYCHTFFFTDHCIRQRSRKWSRAEPGKQVTPAFLFATARVLKTVNRDETWRLSIAREEKQLEHSGWVSQQWNKGW